MRRLWIVPKNDLEAVTIIKLLKKEGETVKITNQNWGASWDALEPEIVSKFHRYDMIYGVELQGKPEFSNYVNIDHHRYQDDDRSNKQSSIEQVANIIGHDMTWYEVLVSENDKGYIPFIINRLAQEEITDPNTMRAIVKSIRAADRKAQGVTSKEEISALRGIHELDFYINEDESTNLFVVSIDHAKCAPVTDRLYGCYKNLLVASPNELNFFGEDRNVLALSESFPDSWSGGSGNSRFWGSQKYDKNDVLIYLKIFLNVHAQEFLMPKSIVNSL